MISAPESRGNSTEDPGAVRPATGVSFSESILSGVSDSPGRPKSVSSTKEEPRDLKDDGFHMEGVTGSRDKPGGGAHPIGDIGTGT